MKVYEQLNMYPSNKNINPVSEPKIRDNYMNYYWYM